MFMDTLRYLSPFLPQLFRKIDLKVKKKKLCNAIITSLQYHCVNTDSVW